MSLYNLTRYFLASSSLYGNKNLPNNKAIIIPIPTNRSLSRVNTVVSPYSAATPTADTVIFIVLNLYELLKLAKYPIIITAALLAVGFFTK